MSLKRSPVVSVMLGDFTGPLAAAIQPAGNIQSTMFFPFAKCALNQSGGF